MRAASRLVSTQLALDNHARREESRRGTQKCVRPTGRAATWIVTLRDPLALRKHFQLLLSGALPHLPPAETAPCEG
jgi:hypothetical protein